MSSAMTTELRAIYKKQLEKLIDIDRQDVDDYLPSDIKNLSREELEREEDRKVMAARMAYSAIIQKMEEMTEDDEEVSDDDEDEDEYEEYDATFSRGKKKPYTDLEIQQFSEALVKNKVFDIGLRSDDENHKHKCWCPCW